MSAPISKDTPILFLGLADHFEPGVQDFPIGGIDLFQLSHHKRHIVYPGMIGENVWVFLISTEFLRTVDSSKWMLQVVDEKNNQIGYARVTPAEDFAASPAVADGGGGQKPFGYWENSQFTILPVKFKNASIYAPGRCNVTCPHRHMRTSTS